jgi:hypothetical protein
MQVPIKVLSSNSMGIPTYGTAHTMFENHSTIWNPYPVEHPPHWVLLDAKRKYNITQFRMQVSNDVSHTPNELLLEVCMDEQEPYTNFVTVTKENGEITTDEQQFNINVTGRIFKLTVLSTHGGWQSYIHDFQFIGAPVPKHTAIKVEKTIKQIVPKGPLELSQVIALWIWKDSPVFQNLPIDTMAIICEYLDDWFTPDTNWITYCNSPGIEEYGTAENIFSEQAIQIWNPYPVEHPPHSVTFDFGRERVIRKFRIASIPDSSHSIRAMQFEESTDGINYHQSEQFSVNTIQKHVVEFEYGTNTRYLKLTITQTFGNWQAYVYGLNFGGI